jgi:hypothetical protein
MLLHGVTRCPASSPPGNGIHSPRGALVTVRVETDRGQLAALLEVVIAPTPRKPRRKPLRPGDLSGPC